MKILGESFQEKQPTPENPQEIKNFNCIFGNIEGQSINIQYNPEIEELDYFYKSRGKWHAKFKYKK